jgi:hypothetical protein
MAVIAFVYQVFSWEGRSSSSRKAGIVFFADLEYADIDYPVSVYCFPIALPPVLILDYACAFRKIAGA